MSVFSSDALKESLGFDPVALAEKYSAERDKRIRGEDEGQFVHVTTDSDFANHYLIDDPYSQKVDREPIEDEKEVIIIGGGWVGMITAARLAQAGVTDMRIVESGADFGGTWYWNRYPGAQCDVESYIYLPLLEETGYMPKLRYSYAPEIHEHARRIGETFDLYPKTVFQTWVTELRWDAGRSNWIVSTNRGDKMRARYVCLGTGPANRPRLPGIPGILDYKGHSFHTSRWDYEYTGGDHGGKLEKLADKTVAIIGTGATAAQCIPALGASAKKLYVFQRTPSSVDLRNNRETDAEWFNALEPGWQEERAATFAAAILGLGEVPREWQDDGWARFAKNIDLLVAIQGSELTAEQRNELTQLADFKTMDEIRARVSENIKNPETAEKLKAFYNQFCKRPVFNDEYLDTFNRPSVELIDVSASKGVERITERGIVANGQEYEVACIVYASGFEITSSYERRIGIPIFGVNERSIYDYWKDGMRGLHGLMVHDFPNLFLGGGLFVFQLGANYANGVDVQARHIAYIIEQLKKKGAMVANASAEAEAEWAAEQLKSPGAGLVLGGAPNSCTPGYYNQEGASTRKRDNRLETYGKGLEAYRKLLRDWREAGQLDGIQIAT